MIREIALAHGDDPTLRARLSGHQHATLEAIATCGTPAAGVHLEVCDGCGDTRMVPNTCGNRSCPHCQGKARHDWVAAREAELLPCGYFHAVLTLPPNVRGLARGFPDVVLGGLMRAAGEAIERCCRDPRHLGATVGQLAVLHTWRRDLHWHPHVHVIVTAGGLNADGDWVEARRYGRQRRAFLVPADVLKAAFARRLRRALLKAYQAGDFAAGPVPAFPQLASRRAFHGWLSTCLATPPVIRIEPPFGGPQQLLRYLGAYVNRVAISPKRILAHDPQAGTVTYTWTTNALPDQAQQACVSAVDFLARFAQHILPPRFMRIRFRGLWATAHRENGLRRAQAALGALPPPAAAQDALPASSAHHDGATPCAHCALGYYRRILGSGERPPRARRRALLQALRKDLRRTPLEAAHCA